MNSFASSSSSTLSVFLLTVAAFLFLLTPSTDAAKCYQCEATNPNCNSPLNPNATGVVVCSDTYCLKSTATASGVTATARICSPTVAYDGCKSFDILGVTTIVCTCNTDYCNGSVGMKSPSVLVGLLSIAFVLFRMG